MATPEDPTSRTPPQTDLWPSTQTAVSRAVESFVREQPPSFDLGAFREVEWITSDSEPQTQEREEEEEEKEIGRMIPDSTTGSGGGFNLDAHMSSRSEWVTDYSQPGTRDQEEFETTTSESRTHEVKESESERKMGGNVDELARKKYLQETVPTLLQKEDCPICLETLFPVTDKPVVKCPNWQRPVHAINNTGFLYHRECTKECWMCEYPLDQEGCLVDAPDAIPAAISDDDSQEFRQVAARWQNSYAQKQLLKGSTCYAAAMSIVCSAYGLPRSQEQCVIDDILVREKGSKDRAKWDWHYAAAVKRLNADPGVKEVWNEIVKNGNSLDALQDNTGGSPQFEAAGLLGEGHEPFSFGGDEDVTVKKVIADNHLFMIARPASSHYYVVVGYVERGNDKRLIVCDPIDGSIGDRLTYKHFAEGKGTAWIVVSER
ncbi:hypothetical protein [Streptomyces sp. NPDC047028]|uniref:hypothetical protein n=1 Tax=Streptomyces sp. NPDC047028 TaxID=3155793 RepID=UPI0033F89FEC